MRVQLPVFLFFAVSVAKVLKLTTKDFKSTVTENKHVLVKFYAPWCGHCKTLAPEYEKAAKMVKDVVFAEVDATEETSLGTEYKVQGYPTMKWFVNGEAQDYDGGRTADTIAEWIKTSTGPSVKEAAPPKRITKLTIVLYGENLTPAFEEVAGKNRRLADFYYVKDSQNKITLQHASESVKEMTEIEDAAAIGAFVKKNEFPLFGILNGETFSKYKERGIGLIWVLLPMKAGEMAKAVKGHRKWVTEVAEKHLDYSFIYTDTVEFKDAVSSMLGITEFPRICVQKKADDKKKFIYDGAMEAEPFTKFLDDVANGVIEPELKSEPVPEKNDEPVFVVVGSQMESEVFRSDMDVLLEVYAPWCGHCKSLEPHYLKLAKKVQKDGLGDILRIAKLDGTANDSTRDTIDWSGFPTIFYIKAKTNEVVKYEGERTAKGLWKFLKKNHSMPTVFNERIAEAKKAREAAKAEKEEPAKEEL